QGYVFDPTIPVEEVTLQPYTEVFQAAMGYFDQAIQELSGKSYTIPANWISHDISADHLARIARSMKARYRAAVARTPAERAAVDWAAVKSDAANGIQEPFLINVRIGSGYSSGTLVNIHRYGPWG